MFEKRICSKKYKFDPTAKSVLAMAFWIELELSHHKSQGSSLKSSDDAYNALSPTLSAESFYSVLLGYLLLAVSHSIILTLLSHIIAGAFEQKTAKLMRA